MGKIKELLFTEIEQEKTIDEEYLFNKYMEEQQVQEYERMQNLIKQSDVSSFLQQ